MKNIHRFFLTVATAFTLSSLSLLSYASYAPYEDEGDASAPVYDGYASDGISGEAGDLESEYANEGLDPNQTTQAPLSSEEQNTSGQNIANDNGPSGIPNE